MTAVETAKGSLHQKFAKISIIRNHQGESISSEYDAEITGV